MVMDSKTRSEYFKNYYQQNRKTILDRAIAYGQERRTEAQRKKNTVGLVKKSGLIVINFMS